MSDRQPIATAPMDGTRPEAYTIPRPSGRDEKYRRIASERTADALVGEGLFGANERDGAVEDILRCAIAGQDGYNLANTLDRRACWSCDLQIALVLDEWDSHLRDAVLEAEKEWAKAINLEQPLLLGTRVSFGRRSETGTLDGLSDYGAGRYLILVDGDEQAVTHKSRRVVAFEDVREIAGAAAEHAP